MSKFYAKALRIWAEISYSVVDNDDLKSILKQSLWNNIFIKFTCDVNCMRRLLNRNVRYINDLWNPNTGFKWEDALERGLSNTDWLTWLGLIRSLPAPWVRTLKNNLQCEIEVFSPIRKIKVFEKLIVLDKVRTNQVYQKIISKKFEHPTAQRRWQAIFQLQSNNSLDWNKIYSLIYSTTIDTKLRWFQYRLLMNCLYVNKDLFKFKLIDNQLCSFCHKYVETIEHLFVYCEVSSKLYFEISMWVKDFNINLPVLNLTSLVIGPSSFSNFSLLINFLLLLFKSYVYRVRLNGRKLEIDGLKAYFKYYERIEYQIAEKKQ